MAAKSRRITKDKFEDMLKLAYSMLDRLDNSLTYHNKAHTTDFVVPAALAIAKAEGFSLEDSMAVGIAAAFHDVGFVSRYCGNEPIGSYAAELCISWVMVRCTYEQFTGIKDAIENTDMKTPPKTKYARVLRDADLAVLGSEKFIETSDNLRKECVSHPESPMHETALDDSRWAQLELAFISSHQWFTESARKLYDKVKQENITKFKRKYEKVLG